MFRNPCAGVLDAQDAFAATDAAGSGSHGLEDGRAIDRDQEGVELGRIARELDGVALFSDIDDAAAEDLGHALHLLALLADGPHLHQHELTLGEAAFGQVDHLHHLDQAVQVLGDLLDDVVRPGGLDGHARQRRVFRRRHGERFDVVATGREQAHHAGKSAGLVFQQYSDDVFHVA